MPLAVPVDPAAESGEVLVGSFIDFLLSGMGDIASVADADDAAGEPSLAHWR